METACVTVPVVGAAGYGVVWLPGRKQTSAHRIAYARVHGAIPAGLVIDHLCRNRACVNVDHLRAVTQRENLLSSPATLPARQAAQTHCVHGHEFTVENTYVTKRRKRQCRECKRERRGNGARS